MRQGKRNTKECQSRSYDILLAGKARHYNLIDFVISWLILRISVPLVMVPLI